MGMVDVTEKPIIKRSAEASGRLYLNPETINEIKAGNIKKGDPLLIAEVFLQYFLCLFQSVRWHFLEQYEMFLH